jgi:hypothetical protein
MSQPGLGWLKDYSFHFLPYMAIARQLVSFILSLGVKKIELWRNKGGGGGGGGGVGGSLFPII